LLERLPQVAAVLTLAAAAVVAGMRSFTAIAGWVADTPSTLLEPLYARCGQRPAVPSRATIWRVVTGSAAEAVDAAVGAWLATRVDIDINECWAVVDRRLRGRSGWPGPGRSAAADRTLSSAC
jgi:hypothetical protein